MRARFLLGLSAFAIAVAECMVSAAPASATIYSWVLSDGGDSGMGTLTTGASDNGGFDITAFSGEIDGDLITGLLGGQPGGGAANSPSGAFIYDNILYPASNSSAGALLDLDGILFSVAGNEGNLWGNFAGSDGYSYYLYSSGNYVIQNNSATFTLSPVFETDSAASAPEPGTLMLLGAGLGLLSLVHRRTGN